MRLIPKFIEAAFAKPEAPVANLESLTHVKGGSGMIFHHAVNRYSGYAASIAGGTEQCDLYKNEAGGWDLVLGKKYGPQETMKKETVGTFATLEEAVPSLRVASDFLKKKHSGFFAAASGHSYFEGEREDGLAAVERALALKKEISSAPQFGIP